MRSGFDVVVVGSLNHDLTVLAPRLPLPGETVIGTARLSGAGGKGANQAVAAARLGARVAMVGLVGDDEYGPLLIDNLKRNGVDVTAVGVHPEAPTGLALITVDPGGENTIVVVAGANMELQPTHLAQHEELIAGARVVMAQLEIPTETVAAAADLATGTFCLNPAPASPLPKSLLSRVDLLVPNRGELAMLADVPGPVSVDEVVGAVNRLTLSGAVAVTLGADGALLMRNEETTLYPAPRVDVADTTGAGDAFCGALAFCVSQERPLAKAVTFAVAAGAIAVGSHGAQDALPTLHQVEALLGR